MAAYHPEAEVQRIAAEKILTRHADLLRQQREVRERQRELVNRDHEIERELAECNAAAKFFDIVLDPFAKDQEVVELRERVRMYQMRAADSRGRPEWAALIRRAGHYEMQLEALLEAKRAEVHSQPTPLKAPPGPEGGLENKRPRVRAIKVRDLVLEQLREAGDAGGKTAKIRARIEAQHSTRLHEKTVGMTLYRLSQEHLVHRIGQTWFYGPQAEQLLPATTESPGAAAPGDSPEQN